MRNKIKSNVKGLKNIIQEVSKVRSIGERRYQTDSVWSGPEVDDDDSCEAIASDAFFATWRISEIHPVCKQVKPFYFDYFDLDGSSKESKLIGKKINRIGKAVQYTKRALYPKFEYEVADLTDRTIYTSFRLPKPIKSINSDEVLRFRETVKDKREFDKVIDKLMKTKGEVYLCYNVVFEVFDSDDDYLRYLDDKFVTDWHIDRTEVYFDEFMGSVK